MAGGGTAALIELGRPALPLISLEWLRLAGAVAGALAAAATIQFAGVRYVARIPTRQAFRAVALSFTPLLLLWPLLLGVTFWDTAHHLFVFHPGVNLWWGGVAFTLAVVQLTLVPVQLDGGATWVRELAVDLWRVTRQAAATHRAGLVVVAAAFVGMRLVVRFGFETGTWLFDAPGFAASHAFATLTDQGVYPYLASWSEYPPGFPWLSAGVFRAVSFFGVNFDRYAGAMSLVLLPFELGTLVLVYGLARAIHGPRRALQASLIYALLPFPLFEWTRTFTTVAVFFLMLSVYLGVRGRWHTAIVAGVWGGLFKVFPLAAAVGLVKFARTPIRRVGVIGVAVFSAAAVVVPLWVAGRPWFDASVRNMSTRPPWQTVWALIDGNLNQGWVNPNRVSLATATEFLYEGRLPAWVWSLPTVALLGFVAILFVRRLPDTPRAHAQLALLVLTAFTLANKGWSPGFVNWLFPLVLVVWPSGRSFLAILVLGAAETFWRPVARELGDPAWITYAAVIIRTVVLGWLAVRLWTDLRMTTPSDAGGPASATNLARADPGGSSVSP